MEQRPYTFISYCHRDNDAVLPLLDKMQERGLNLWFDKGIEVGSEWPEFIANSLLNSSSVVAFVSPNALASHNCRREINFAIDKKLDIIIAYLEDTQLSPGMELQSIRCRPFSAAITRMMTHLLRRSWQLPSWRRASRRRLSRSRSLSPS